jgi:transcriptional regulator with XRE-family HTH domain
MLAVIDAALSQAQFAALMGVSVRTLQDWEQGRRNPSGANRMQSAERFRPIFWPIVTGNVAYRG